jgi:metal-sulfur cluster biosynthetic enzyme
VTGRASGTPAAAEQAVLDALREVKDPEVPVLDIVELGIVRGADVEGRDVTVRLTPTYSGCPASRSTPSTIARLSRRAHSSVDAISAATRKLPPMVGVLPFPALSASLTSSACGAFVTSSRMRRAVSQRITCFPHHSESRNAVSAAIAMRNEM